MHHRQLDVLFEDNHLLIVNKPAGLPTMGTEEGRESLVTVAKEYIRTRYQKPGNVYLGVVSRVDSLVTGAVVLARTSKAAARLTEQFRSRTVTKVYWALVEGRVTQPGHCQDWLRHDDRAMRMVICRTSQPEGKEARLSFRPLASVGTSTLLEVNLLTGRKHQIRLQLAQLGHPILGDQKYGSPRHFPLGIALHARQLQLLHPVQKTPLALTAPLPNAWRAAGVTEKVEKIAESVPKSLPLSDSNG